MRKGCDLSDVHMDRNAGCSRDKGRHPCEDLSLVIRISSDARPAVSGKARIDRRRPCMAVFLAF